jgi:hypothetical protein
MALFQGVKLAGAGKVTKDKARHDFDTRAASVRALLLAQERVAHEKGDDSQEVRDHQRAQALLAEAEALGAQGDPVAGREVLDRAYEALKTSIERMRGGETLENRIVFTGVEDEYRYYWEKTASQLGAIEMAASSVAGTSKEQAVKRFAAKMTDARAKAGGLAESGDYAQAVKVLVPLFQMAPYQLMSLLR